jgi:preprotein translocase subunit SecY
VAQGISKLPEGTLNTLQKKILFTLLFLAIYRVGVHIPIAGVDSPALGEFFKTQGANLFGMFNMFSGGALERFSVFALGVMPYISASIIAQLLTVVVPYLEQLSKEGEAGRRKINQYTRYATMVLALFQGYMIAAGLESQTFQGGRLVLEGGLAWRLMTALSLTAGTAFVMWLGERITEFGVGNGMSLIIFSGIVAGLPRIVANTYSQYAQSQMDMGRVLMIIALVVVIIAGVAFMEQGVRQIPVQYAKRQVGGKVFGGQTSYLPIRLNSAGVIPPIFASSLLQFPQTIAAVYPQSAASQFVTSVFNPGGWLYNTVDVILIVFFAFFYTSITFKPDDIAENLKKHGGFVPGIRPGARTSEFIDKIVTRLTLIGAIYLSGVCILPSIFADQFGVQFYFGGTSLLIVVGTALETYRQIETHRQQLRYDVFVKRGVIKPRRSGV